MLGKRSRAVPMKRTTSMTGITVDPEGPRSLDPQNPIITDETMASGGPEERYLMVGQSGGNDHRTSSALLSPRFYTRDSADRHLQTAHFLRTCGLCNRRLAPGRDIYMYRGDTAFCSQECREQQMKHDERKEKYAVAASKKVESHRNHSEFAASAGSETSGNGGTVAAA